MKRSSYFVYGLYLGETVIGSMLLIDVARRQDSLWPYFLAIFLFGVFVVLSAYLMMRSVFEDRWFASEPEPKLDKYPLDS